MNGGQSADEAHDFPAIVITAPAQNLRSTEEDALSNPPSGAPGVTHNAFPTSFYGEVSTENEVYRDWEARYTAAPISQADFFAPAVLRAPHHSDRPTVALKDDGDVVFNPSVPRIVIIGPEAEDIPLSPRDSPVLTKAVPLDRKVPIVDETNPQLRPRAGLRERRHSISMVPERPRDRKSSATEVSTTSFQATPTPRPWAATDLDLVGGWKMRTRCSDPISTATKADVVMIYLYNSSLCDKTRDRDADLGLFRHMNPTDPAKPVSTPAAQLQRARTDLADHSRKMLPAMFTSTPNRPNRGQLSDSQKHQTQPVDWLQDHEMLRKQMPSVRIITIGFDIFPFLSLIPDFDAAAKQLMRHLEHLRKQQETPMLLLGHAFGGVILIHYLVLVSSKAPTTKNALSCVAGAFLFSCSLTHTDEWVRSIAGLYGAKPSDVCFNYLLDSPAMERLSKMAKTTLHHPQRRKRSFLSGPPPCQKAPPKSKHIDIVFPVTQFLAKGDDQAFGPNLISKLFGTSVRTVTMSKDTMNAMKFPGSQDMDFLRVVSLLRSCLQSHRLLRAAVAGNVKEIEVLLRRGTNPNLRDRLSQTALQIAVRLDHENIVHTLIRADGIDLNVRDDKLNTPLHHAVRSGNETIIRTLLYHGADVHLENSHKRTARDLAEKHKSRMHVAKMLRSRLINGPDQSLRAKRVGTGSLPLTDVGRLACKNFQITVTEIYTSKSTDKHWSVNVSVEALLYGPNTLSGILDQVRPKAVNPKALVCTWIHVPENNMIWVEDLFAKLDLHQAIWQDTKRSITDSLRNRAITPHIGEGDLFSMFLPYLSYEANFRQAKRTQYIQIVHEEYERERFANANIPQEVHSNLTERSSRTVAGEGPVLLRIPDAANLESYPYADRDLDSDSDFSEHHEIGDPDDLEEEEKAHIRAYLHSPPALHIRRTLDEFYYHMLESTEERDIDQVVSRWSQTVRSEARHNILMVDQLWLWTVQQKPSTPGVADGKTQSFKQLEQASVGTQPQERNRDRYIISCFPSRTGTGQALHRSLDNLRLLVLDPNRRKRDPIRRPEDLISRIVETCCGVFDRLQDVESLRFFQMFEDSIGTIDDKESRLFRDFQRGSTRLLELSPVNKYYNQKKNALLIDLLDIREEIKLLVEVKDIRDEINIILSVLGIQRTLLEQLSPLTAGNSTTKLPNSVAENLVKSDISDFTKLDSQTRTIQEKLNTLMDLKQKAANAWEAREARETTVAASKQGSTVLVFTVVTIIFLPLSFMSSFFAIGIAAFPKDANSGQTNWPLGIITGLLFGISLCVSIPLIVFALNMEYCSAIYKELRHNYFARIGIRLIELLPTLPAEEAPISKRKQWTERLQKCYDDYVQDDDEVGTEPQKLEKLDVLRQFDHDTKPAVSFPSTVRSSTLVNTEEEKEEEKEEVLPPPPVQGMFRRAGIRRMGISRETGLHEV